MFLRKRFRGCFERCRRVSHRVSSNGPVSVLGDEGHEWSLDLDNFHESCEIELAIEDEIMHICDESCNLVLELVKAFVFVYGLCVVVLIVRVHVMTDFYVVFVVVLVLVVVVVVFSDEDFDFGFCGPNAICKLRSLD